MIKPGTPCYVINCASHPDLIGHVVTVTGPKTRMWCIQTYAIYIAYPVTPSLKSNVDINLVRGFHESCLLPIIPPINDSDVDQKTDIVEPMCNVI